MRRIITVDGVRFDRIDPSEARAMETPIVQATRAELLERYPRPPGSNAARAKRERRRASQAFVPSRKLLQYRAEMDAAEAAFTGGPSAEDARRAAQQIIEEVRSERETRRIAPGGRIEPVGASAVVPLTDPVRRAGPSERAPLSRTTTTPPVKALRHRPGPTRSGL